MPTLSVDGDTSVVMSTMVNVSVPFTVASAANVAVIVAEPAAAGATYVAVAGVVGGVTGVSVPPPLRLQVTAELFAFDTAAVSVRVWVG